LISAQRASYYADHHSIANCNSHGSSCSLMTMPKYAGDDPFFNNGSYLYRCDFAQHVVSSFSLSNHI
jgi:hypothetical protein